MRVVLLHHFPLEHTHAGPLVRCWQAALTAAGNQVRVLLIDRQRPAAPDGVDRIVCSATAADADLAFDLPQFSETGTGPTFAELSDDQLAEYRDCQRQRLDAIVSEFDPHVIHAQHVWVQGQLALESGVPYVLSAWGPELDETRRDARYQPLVAQAAENAGRILTPSQALAHQVVAAFDIPPERTLVAADLATPVDASRYEQLGKQLAALYAAVYDERFGPLD